jgi:hypothetical protein
MAALSIALSLMDSSPVRGGYERLQPAR